MFEDLRRLSAQAGMYALGSAGQRALQFLLLPIYTRLLTPHDYGILEILTIFSLAAGIVMGFGLRPSFTRVYLYEGGTNEGRDKPRILSTALLTSIAFSTGLLGLILPASGLIAGWLLDDASLGHLVRLAGFMAWSGAILQIAQAYLASNNRAGLFVTLSTLQLAVTLGLAIYWVVIARQGVEGVLLANAISGSVFAVVIPVWLFTKFGMAVDRAWLRTMLRYGVPLFAGAAATLVTDFADRFFLQHFASLYDVGLYAVANKLSMAFAVVFVGAFTGAYVPFQYELGRREDHVHVLPRLTLVVVAVFAALALGLGIFARELLAMLVAPEFRSAHGVVIWLAMAQVVYVACFVLFTSVNLSGRFELGIPIVFAVAVVNLGLNFFLIPRFGLLGAGFAAICTNIAHAAMIIVAGRRVYPSVRYPVGACAMIVTAMLLAYYASIAARMLMPMPWLELAAAAAIWILCVVVLGGVITSPEERGRLRERIRNRTAGKTEPLGL